MYEVCFVLIVKHILDSIWSMVSRRWPGKEDYKPVSAGNPQLIPPLRPESGMVLCGSRTIQQRQLIRSVPHIYSLYHQKRQSDRLRSRRSMCVTGHWYSWKHCNPRFIWLFGVGQYEVVNAISFFSAPRQSWLTMYELCRSHYRTLLPSMSWLEGLFLVPKQ